MNRQSNEHKCLINTAGRSALNGPLIEKCHFDEKIRAVRKKIMNPENLIERAVQSATHCEAQGFHETAKSLRALAEEMRAASAASIALAGFGDVPTASFYQRT